MRIPATRAERAAVTCRALAACWLIWLVGCERFVGIEDTVVAFDCRAEADYGDAVALSASAFAEGSVEADPDRMALVAQLTEPPFPDQFVLELYREDGVFADGIVPGAFNVAFPHTQYSQCEFCLRVLTDAEPEPVDDGYLATSGVLELESTRDSLAGRVNDVVFRHVVIESDVSSPHPDGCETRIRSLAFDAPVEFTRSLVGSLTSAATRSPVGPNQPVPRF